MDSCAAIFDWLTHSILTSSGVLAVGSLAAYFAPSPAHRTRIIHWSLLGCICASFAGFIPGWPQWHLGIVSNSARVASAPQPVQTSAPGESRALMATAQPILPSRPMPRSSAPPLRTTTKVEQQCRPVGDYVAVAYVLIVLLMTGLGVVGHWRLFQLCQSAHEAPVTARQQLRRIAGPASDRIRLWVSEQLDRPLTFGCSKPVIILPESVCRSSSPQTLEWCLAHEWSHIERKDVRGWYVASLAAVLFFYQPLVWWMRRKLRLLQELFADAKAAGENCRLDYAEFLLKLARRRSGFLPVAALSSKPGKSDLSRRIEMLVQNDESLDYKCSVAWSAAVGVSAILFAFGVSAIRLEAAGPQERSENLTSSPPVSVTVANQAITFTGRVVDQETNRPIAGARVLVKRQLIWVDPLQITKTLTETEHETDAEGKYTFTIAPEHAANRWLFLNIEASHPRYIREFDNGELRNLQENLRFGGHLFTNLKMRPGVEAGGQVFSLDGPARGIRIDVGAPVKDSAIPVYWLRATTDEQGRFSVLVPKAEEYIVVAQSDKYAPAARHIRGIGDWGHFDLSQGVSIRGRVLDESGKPLKGQRVQALTNQIFHNWMAPISRGAITDNNGEFEMKPLPKGSYTVRVVDQLPESLGGDDRRYPLAHAFPHETIELADGSAEHFLEIKAAPFVTVEAESVDRDGWPVTKTVTGASLWGWINGKQWFIQGYSDDRGQIVIRAPKGLDAKGFRISSSPVRIQLSPDAPLSEPNPELSLGVLNQDVRGLRIVNYDASNLFIRVLDRSSGFPIKDAKVTGKTMGKNSRVKEVRFDSDGDGRFRNDDGFMPGETIRVSVSADGYVSFDREVSIADEKPRAMTIHLGTSGSDAIVETISSTEAKVNQR